MKNVYNEYGITPEILKSNTKDKELKLFLEQIEGQVFTLGTVPIEFLVNSNG